MTVDMLIKIFYSKNMFKKLLISVITVFTFLTFAFPAEASTLYLSPGSKNIPQGTTVSVSVGISTGGESVNGVSAYLSYPTDKLEVASIYYGSRFDLAAEGTYGGGSIRISRGSIAGVVGNVTIATISFRGKSLGQGTVAFVGGSAAPRTSDSSDSLNLGGSAGGVYTVVVPPPVAPTPTGQQVIPLAISNVKTSSISTTSATITWETNRESDSTVEYGLLPNKYFLSLSDETLTVTHTAKLEGGALVPGATFHFRVKSKDEKGNEAVSNNYSFQIKGFDVTVRIKDFANNPVADTNVYLYTDPQKSRTDSNGEAHFANVTPGKHLVVVKLKNNFEKTGDIEVLDTPLSQSFVVPVDTTIKAGVDNTGLLIGLLVIVTILVVIIIIIAILVIKKRPGGEETSQEQQPLQTWQQQPSEETSNVQTLEQPPSPPIQPPVQP
jgi:hypothetical protein